MSTEPHLQPACFLDRDGVVIEEVDFLDEPRQVRLIDGAARAIARLHAAGVPAIVVTNQSGVARGRFPETRIGEVHAALDALLAAAGARVDAYYYCPHHPEAEVAAYRVACRCRKPEPGMLEQAAREHGIDLARSCLIGDKPSDIEAAYAAGCRGILVRTGYGNGCDVAELEARGFRPAFVAASIVEAIDWFLEDRSERRG